MNYKNKYLKYKKKYLILKNIVQKGGFSRYQILITYKEDVSSFEENKELNLAELLNSYNIDYKLRKPKEIGMWYGSDYSKLVNENDDSNQFIGFANDKYWNITVSKRYGDSLVSYFQSFDYIKPSDALKSFIIGPTFTECANVIQVTIYHHILNLVGEDEFNDLFGNLLTPFIITPTLYTPWKIIKRKELNKEYEPIMENPLYFLCDKIEDISLESLKNNDIVYIEGIPKYNLKHFSGDLIGYNLICIRPSTSDNPKFIGFGPNVFNGAKTYDDIRKILIDGYNQEQDENTKTIIKARLKSGNKIMKISAETARSLENDKVTKDEPINGIIYGLRFNENNLKRFRESEKQEWYTESDETLKALLPIANKIEINLLLDSFSFETKDATFDNYISTPQLDKIFNYMKLFALKIVTKPTEYGPIGIILSGTPGIGKTHLSVSVAKFVSTYGKKVTFVDADYINSKVTDKGIPDFNSTFKDSDLIILDDINSKYDNAVVFVREALSYVIENNKALLYTSNNIIPIIQKNLPIFFGYDHPFAKNFIAINNINAESYRKPWTDKVLKSLPNEEKYKLLHNYSGGLGAGIIIETGDMNETKYIDEYNKYNGFTEKLLPIRIIKGYPDKVTDLKKDEIIIISVDEYKKTVELIDILPEIHSKGIKVIVLTKSVEGFKNEITKHLNYFSNLPKKPRLIARLNTIFPKIDF
jgi:DNA replication protein DnaC